MQNLHLTYFWLVLHRTKVRWRFHKNLWPSQNIWTLQTSELLRTIALLYDSLPVSAYKPVRLKFQPLYNYCNKSQNIRTICCKLLYFEKLRFCPIFMKFLNDTFDFLNAQPFNDLVWYFLVSMIIVFCSNFWWSDFS